MKGRLPFRSEKRSGTMDCMDGSMRLGLVNSSLCSSGDAQDMERINVTKLTRTLISGWRLCNVVVTEQILDEACLPPILHSTADVWSVALVKLPRIKHKQGWMVSTPHAPARRPPHRQPISDLTGPVGIITRARQMPSRLNAPSLFTRGPTCRLGGRIKTGETTRHLGNMATGVYLSCEPRLAGLVAGEKDG